MTGTDSPVKSPEPNRTEGLRVAIRADAALQMGTGHIMRCLTLAQALRARGAQVGFICRAHAGNLTGVIEQQGFEVHELPEQMPPPELPNPSAQGAAAYASWLGASWQEDARQTAHCLRGYCPDVLLVDHYGIDAAWESAVADQVGCVAVIDDLANRPHHCHVLIDQTLYRQASDYAPWVPAGCQVLAGTDYAMLRAEFCAPGTRPPAETPAKVRHVMLCLGGVDAQNVTQAVLQVIAPTLLRESIRLEVILGRQFPHLASVEALVAQQSLPVSLSVGVNTMAQRMALADLAIGAPGTSAWERCAMGLPTLMVVLAANQYDNARALARAGVARVGAWEPGEIASGAFLAHWQQVLADVPWRTQARQRAIQLCDGRGVDRIVARIMQFVAGA